MIIPSIDLMGGKAVQLVGGKRKVLERDDIDELAREFSLYGDLAVIDLDAAMGKGDNLDIIKKLCQMFDCRVGGGIRSIERANEILGAGAKKIIIGTNANKKFLSQLPRSRLIVALDTKQGYVVKEGWRKSTSMRPQELMRELERYCSEFLFTNVDREGLQEGCDLRIVETLAQTTKNKLTVAGGITTIPEIRALNALGVNIQLGMAIYTGKLSLAEAFITGIDFTKNNGLVPTIVQNTKKQILMLAYSNAESLRQSLASKQCTYFSRSRNQLWRKGATSANTQELQKVLTDCDGDTLLFTVVQKGSACHTARYSCFEDKQFSLEELYETLLDRLEKMPKESYTASLGRDPAKLREKIMEEAAEVVEYTDRENLVWEIADLTYAVMVLMAKNKIRPQKIWSELGRRRQ